MSLIRNFFKIFFIFQNRERWYDFDQKFLSYFTEIVPHYTYFNYFKIITSSKIARNALAWHVEDYLKIKGIKE